MHPAKGCYSAKTFVTVFPRKFAPSNYNYTVVYISVLAQELYIALCNVGVCFCSCFQLHDLHHAHPHHAHPHHTTHTPHTQWQVASLALEILHKLLLSYEVSPEDFVNQYYDTPEMGGAMVPKQPGHTLLLHMLNDSKLLRKV